MYRVVLIDDEPLILEGLRRVVRWEDFGCEVVETAEDAIGGAEVIRRLRPDILFTDIRMPGDDGLTMLAGLRSEFPDMQVTVLTGYRDFTYAQEAIRLGVTRFLLKPSRMDEIQEALRAMTERLGRRRQEKTLADENLSDGKPSGEKQSDEKYTDEKQTERKLTDENRPGEEKPENGTDSERESEREAAGSFIAKQALSYMKKHRTEKLTLQDVADACYVSQWHLSKLLNRYTGKSFYDILHSLRMEEAKKLLADPSLRIGDIGEMVGYADTAHFARIFKKLVGMSANEYRNRL